MARPTITHYLGADRDYDVVLKNFSRQVETTYTLANPLTAAIWPGDSRAALATPAIAWVDPAAGSCTLTIAQADVADLEPGSYRLRAWVGEANGVRRVIVEENLALVAEPGSGTPPKTYGTFDQICLFYPGIAKLKADPDETNFAEQRARARTWFEDVVAAHWRGSSYGAAYGGYLAYAAPYDLSYIRGLLDADRLVITDTIREIVSKKALSYVLMAQLADQATTAAGRASAPQQLAAQFARDAETLARCLVAEISLPSGGSLYIDCSSAPARRG